MSRMQYPTARKNFSGLCTTVVIRTCKKLSGHWSAIQLYINISELYALRQAASVSWVFILVNLFFFFLILT